MEWKAEETKYIYIIKKQDRSDVHAAKMRSKLTYILRKTLKVYMAWIRIHVTWETF